MQISACLQFVKRSTVKSAIQTTRPHTVLENTSASTGSDSFLHRYTEVRMQQNNHSHGLYTNVETLHGSDLSQDASITPTRHSQ